jgi:hypothetical protein
MLLKRIGTTALIGMALWSTAHAGMYAWSTAGDGKVHSWSSDGKGAPPPQFYSWNAPDGSASYWSYSTPNYSMWSYPPQFYTWNAPYNYYPPMYFYYPMYPYGGMYYYQLPPPPQK